MSASATINVVIDNTSMSLLVVYPHRSAKLDFLDDGLKLELEVIKGWFVEFNGNVKNLKGMSPDDYVCYPASTILVTRDFHGSTHTPNEPLHITGRISSAAAWQLDPRENNGCVHIYAGGTNNAMGGYTGWVMKNTDRNKMMSPAIVKEIRDALANNRGVLGEDNLA